MFFSTVFLSCPFSQISEFKKSLNTVNSACDEVCSANDDVGFCVVYTFIFLHKGHEYLCFLGPEFPQIERYFEENSVSGEYTESRNCTG